MTLNSFQLSFVIVHWVILFCMQCKMYYISENAVCKICDDTTQSKRLTNEINYMSLV